MFVPLFEDISKEATMNSFPYIFLPVGFFLGIGMLMLSGLCNCAIASCYRRRRHLQNLSELEVRLGESVV